MIEPVSPSPPPDDLEALLTGAGFKPAGAGFAPVALTGGVSSDIVRVATDQGLVCVKRALARLKTARDWFAPLARSDNEVAWIRHVARTHPDAVPRILHHDPDRHAFVMAYLDPADHPVWKAELLAGRIAPETAEAVGRLVGQIHSASADDPDLARRFATDAEFKALRIDPYLGAIRAAHPDLGDRIDAVIAMVSGTRRALVHGDVSPKNILVGPKGPVLLDAECAWFGDPAFDITFCLNHLGLKAALAPGRVEALAASARAAWRAWRAAVTWEAVGALDQRAGPLLFALMLARVDGTSPVDYLAETARGRVRALARDGLTRALSVSDGLDFIFGEIATWRTT